MPTEPKAEEKEKEEEFTSIPILNYTHALSLTTKPSFLSELRHALLHVGFFYLVHAPITPDVRHNLIQMTYKLFDLPAEKKLEIEMVNSKHFLGYSRLGAETTARRVDWREQFDFATELPPPPEGAPLYRNIRGPNQWPDETSIPGFRHAVESYLSELSPLATSFQTLIAEALDLPPTALHQFFETPTQQKLKLIKYPPPPSPSTSPSTSQPQDPTQTQGVGAHKDSEFLTFLLQPTPHTGLEVQNKSGEWIPAPPLPDSLVVNIGRAFEAITRGVCSATTHRVNLAPENFFGPDRKALGARFSIPVFQGMSLDLQADKIGLDIPGFEAGGGGVQSDAEKTFNEVFRGRVGEGTLVHRVMSHQDVGRRWYPELLEWALGE
ncbi:oxidoreductase, partial [Aspergillus ellipticus CBS 707.79]